MINTNEGTCTPLIDFNAYPVKNVLDALLQITPEILRTFGFPL